MHTYEKIKDGYAIRFLSGTYELTIMEVDNKPDAMVITCFLNGGAAMWERVCVAMTWRAVK